MADVYSIVFVSTHEEVARQQVLRIDMMMTAMIRGSNPPKQLPGIDLIYLLVDPQDMYVGLCVRPIC